MTSDRFLNSPESCFFLYPMEIVCISSVGVCLAHCCISPSDTVSGMCVVDHQIFIFIFIFIYLFIQEIFTECIEIQVLWVL